MCDVLRKGWRLVESLFMWLHVCVVVNCAMLWKWSSPHYLCELVIYIILRHWLWQVLCALRKNGYLRGCSISSDVSRAVMDTIFRGTYHAPWWLLLSSVVSCAATDAWTDMSPMGPGLRDSGCVSLRKTCITIFDIASHGIAHFYYWWTWTCVLLILWLFLCEACDCWIWSCYWECVNC